MDDADAFQFLPQDTPLQVFRIDGQAGQFGQFEHSEKGGFFSNSEKSKLIILLPQQI